MPLAGAAAEAWVVVINEDAPIDLRAKMATASTRVIRVIILVRAMFGLFLIVRDVRMIDLAFPFGVMGVAVVFTIDASTIYQVHF